MTWALICQVIVVYNIFAGVAFGFDIQYPVKVGGGCIWLAHF